MSASTDRDGEVLLVHYHVHGVLVLIHEDRRHLGRRERTDHELRRVLRPQHDVHALARELLGHGLDARAAHSDAGSDRVDALVTGVHGDLRANTRVAGGRLDLEQSFLDFGDFEPEQFHDEFGRGARQNQLRSAHIAVDAHDEGAHAVAHAQILLGDHLVARQHRLDAPDLDDRVAALDALDRAVDELFAATEKIVQQLLAFGVADPLEDDLFRGLRPDAAEIDRLESLFDIVPELNVRVLLLRLRECDLLGRILHRFIGRHQPAAEGLEVPGIAVDRDAHVHVLVEALLRRGSDRHLQGAEHHVLVDVLLPCERVRLQQQFAAHISLGHHGLGTRRARSRSARSNASRPLS